MKRTLKTAIIAIVLLASLLASLFALTACNDVASNYVSAKEAWDSAANKMSTDTGVIDATLGSGENALPVTITLEGKCVYLGGEFRMDYTVKVDGLADIASGFLSTTIKKGLTINLSAHKNSAGVFTLNATADVYLYEDMESPIKYPLVNGVTFTEQSLHDTIPVLDFGMNTFYDAELISGSASNYSIPGESALDWILQQVAPILAYDAGYDIMPMIYDWIDFGDVTGSVTFSDGNFSAMTTSQDITAFMPYEDAEFLAYNVEFFPMILFNLIENKTIDIAGLITLDFSGIITDGIRIEGNVSTAAEYTILPDDATMESVLG